MQKLKILILEDTLEEASLLEGFLLDRYEIIGIAKNFNEAVAFYHLYKPDLAILDIFINEEREGIRFAEYINTKEPIPLLFLTNAKDTLSFSSAKKTNPFSYMLKPVDLYGIHFNIELALEKFVNGVGQLSTKDSSVIRMNKELFIKKKDSLFKISKDDVFYVEADDKYCHIFTDENKFLVQKSLSSFAEEFSELFIRTHRKYLINRTQISRIDVADYNIILQNEVSIPLSHRHKKEVLALFNILK